MMKKVFVFVTAVLYIIISVTILELARSNGVRLLLWEETSVTDFSDNQLENLIITNTSGGEVSFPEPIQKTVPDYQDNTIQRFGSYDGNNNFIHIWIQYGDIFVRKYNANGDTVSPVLQVNDEEGIAGNSTNVRCALLDNGYICVVWETQDSGDHDMYGQIFSDTYTKIDSNFIINEIPNYSNYIVAVWANNSENTFWMLHSLRQDEAYKILVQKRTLEAQKSGETFLLNSDNPTVFEGYPAVLTDDTGNLIVVWDGANVNNSDWIDVYVRVFNSSGVPLGPAVKVNDEIIPTWNGQPDIGKDENGNLLIAWSDFRDNTSEFHPYTYAIYGQMVNHRLEKLGKNFRINTPAYYSNFYPDVDYRDGEFCITWLASNNVYANNWKFFDFISGTMISSVFDTGPGGATYRYITWDRSLPSGTMIKFKFRSADRLNDLVSSRWYGPVDTTGFYTVYTGQEINSIHDSQRFIQYKSFFEIEKPGVSPVLNSVVIGFTPLDSIAPVSPNGLTATAGHSQVVLAWIANQDADLAGYRLYRRLSGNIFDGSWKIQFPALTTTYTDTSAITGTKYFYVLTAVDSSKNESSYSQEVAATPYGINIYVSPDGSSDGSGTVHNPLLTITQGLLQAMYGDIVAVMPGSYNESIELKKGVSVIGSGSNETELTGTREDYIVKGQDEALLRGFSLIRNSDHPLNAIHCEKSAPIIMDNVIVCYTLNEDAAIYCRENAKPMIIRNYISGFGMGIMFVDGSDSEIRNNLIDVSSIGIRSAIDDTLKIINNSILVNAYCGIEMIDPWRVGNN